MGEDRFLSLIEALRSRGRVTTARRALLGALTSAESHRTAEELADEVRAAHPAVHRATIYRSLDALTEMGLIEHTHLGHGPAVYHLAEGAHQHLVCEACGLVTEAPASLFEELASTVRREYGFEIMSRHFAVVGRCRRCAPAHAPLGTATVGDG